MSMLLVKFYDNKHQLTTVFTYRLENTKIIEKNILFILHNHCY